MGSLPGTSLAGLVPAVLCQSRWLLLSGYVSADRITHVALRATSIMDCRFDRGSEQEDAGSQDEQGGQGRKEQ